MKKPGIHRLIDLQYLLLQFHNIERQVSHLDIDRRETDTEHSYSLAIAGWFLAQYFPDLDRDTVIRFALVHDLVEIYAGDTFAFAGADAKRDKAEREADALARLAREWPDFPEMTDTIQDYEARNTPEAKFVYALDKLMPILLNYLNKGGVWRRHKVTFEQFVAEKEAKIPVSPEIYAYYQQLLDVLKDHMDFFAESNQ